MHSILDSEHVYWAAGLLQPLEQAALKKQILPSLRQHCGRQLLRVSNQYNPTQKRTWILLYSVSGAAEIGNSNLGCISATLQDEELTDA